MTRQWRLMLFLILAATLSTFTEAASSSTSQHAVAVRLLAGESGVSASHWPAGVSFTLEVSGQQLEGGQVLIVESSGCGNSSIHATHASALSGPLAEGAPPVVTSVASQLTVWQWSGLQLLRGGQYGVCWCSGGACIAEFDFVQVASFNIFGPSGLQDRLGRPLSDDFSNAANPSFNESFSLQVVGLNLTAEDRAMVVNATGNCSSPDGLQGTVALRVLQGYGMPDSIDSIEVFGEQSGGLGARAWPGLYSTEVRTLRVCWCIGAPSIGVSGNTVTNLGGSLRRMYAETAVNLSNRTMAEMEFMPLNASQRAEARNGTDINGTVSEIEVVPRSEEALNTSLNTSLVAEALNMNASSSCSGTDFSAHIATLHHFHFLHVAVAMGRFRMQSQVCLLIFFIVNTSRDVNNRDRALYLSEVYEMSAEGHMEKHHLSENVSTTSEPQRSQEETPDASQSTTLPPAVAAPPFRMSRRNSIAAQYEGRVTFDIKELYWQSPLDEEGDPIVQTKKAPDGDWLPYSELRESFETEYNMMQSLIRNAKVDFEGINLMSKLYSGLLENVPIHDASTLIMILDSQRGGSWSASWLSQQNWPETGKREREASMFLEVLNHKEQRDEWIADNFGESLLFFEAIVYSMGTMAIHNKEAEIGRLRIDPRIVEAIVHDAGVLRGAIETLYPERKLVNESQAFMDQAGKDSLETKASKIGEIYSENSLWVRVKTFGEVPAKMRENWFFYRLGLKSDGSADGFSSLVSVGLRKNIPMGGHVSSSVGLLYTSAKYLCGKIGAPTIVPDNALLFGTLMMWPFHTSHSHTVAEVIAGMDLVHRNDDRWKSRARFDGWPEQVTLPAVLSLMEGRDHAENVDRAEHWLNTCRSYGILLLTKYGSPQKAHPKPAIRNRRPIGAPRGAVTASADPYDANMSAL